MKKRVSALLLALLLLCAAVYTVSAEEEEDIFIYDTCDLLSDEEFWSLYEQAADVSQRHGCGVYVAIFADMAQYDYHNIEAFAEAVYTQWGLGVGPEQTGIMLVLSMAERDYDLAAYGNDAHYAFTDYGKSVLAEEFLDDFRYNDWAAGFSDYIRACDEYLTYAENGQPVDVGGYSGLETVPLTLEERLRNSLPMALIVGAVCALIYCGILKGQMKSAREATNADDYVVPGSAELRIRKDYFSHTTKTRVKIESSSSKSGGGGTHVSSGGFSHSSGKF